MAHPDAGKSGLVEVRHSYILVLPGEFHILVCPGGEVGKNAVVTLVLRAATRGSELARWQAAHVAELVHAVAPGVRVEPLVVRTRGDLEADRPIWELGGKGVFVTEVQAAVLDGRADLAVHSAKDLPSVEVEGLALAAVPPRGDPRDALVGATLDTLGPGARVATGSVRRRVQLAHLRPDLTFCGLRGNMATRLAVVDDPGAGVDAVVAAVAALARLEQSHRIAQILDPADMVPQVGQGALAVECRADDERTRALLAQIEEPGSRRAVDAERGFLAELGGDCDLPAGAHASAAADQAGEPCLELDAMLASLDGHVVLRAQRRCGPGDSPAAVGRALARHLLDDAGGRALLDR